MKLPKFGFFIMLLLLNQAVQAQNFNLGVKAGLNLYNISSSTGVTTDYRLGFNAGLLGHIHLSDTWAIQPELLFSSQGAKANTTTTTLNYINVPVLFQYMFNNGFRIQAGPQLGILLSAKSTANNNTSDIRDNLRTAEVGLSVGVSYVHPPSDIGVDLRYNLGLTNINKSDAVKSYNRGFQLGVFYLINHD